MSFRERRAAKRTWGAYRHALLSIPRLRHVHSCGVRDVSKDGAGLRLNRLPLLPSEFNLSLDGFHTTLVCRLIWRDGDFAGVAFQPASDGR
jgi:hypothetical protein